MSDARPFTPIDRLVELYRDLGTLDAVAEIVGRTRTSVHIRLQRAGVDMSPNRLTDAEIDRIRQYYAETDASTFSLAALSAELGRQKTSVSRVARKLGLTDLCRKASASTRAKQKAVHANRWQNVPHPRGMLGKKHTAEICAALSERSKRKWATDKAFGIGFMSEDARQKRSDMAAKRMAGAPASNNYSRTKSGRRDDLGGLFVRSSWEANYARYLNLLVKMKIVEWWEYEPKVFWFEAIKRGTRSYTPDFRVKYANDPTLVYVEVKGWMDQKSKTKLKRMKKYYPHIKIELVGKKQYEAIKRQWSSAIPGWE